MERVDRARVVAFRVWRQDLHRTARAVTDLRVLDLGVQDTGSGSTLVAVAARLPGDAPLDDGSLVVAWAHRGAPHLLRRAELPALAAALRPHSDGDAIARLGSCGTALRRAGFAGLDVVTRAAAAMRASVVEPKPRGLVSGEVTAALPPEFSHACGPCAATHVYGSLFQLVGLAAAVEVRAGRPTVLAPLDERYPPPTEGDASTVVAAYLRLHGPATLADAAAFLGTTQTHARHAWPADLVPVEVDGRTAYLPPEDLDALLDAPDADLVRLLPAGDPLLQARDRETYVPDEAHRKALWRVISAPGAVLAGGRVAGLWRAKAAGTRLDVTVTPFGPLSVQRLEAEAGRVAAARGYRDVHVFLS